MSITAIPRRLMIICPRTPAFKQTQYRMSDDTQNINRLKFDRVNEQINYERRFISRHKAEVTIPTIPYEGFDVFSPDTRVKPWSLLDLIISARIFTQWPAAKAYRPNDSFLDAHKLLSVPNQAIYFVGLRLDISREFNDFRTPKFPLVIQQELVYVGKSSARKQYTLKHPEMNIPLVDCYFDDVLINKSTGKGSAFPEWWKDKYSFVNDLKEKPVTVEPDTPNDKELCENIYRVEFDDLDHNLHTTSSSYLRFCFSAAFTNINHSKYDKVNFDCFNAGSKSVVIQFFQETRHGDILSVHSWEDLNSSNMLHFSILKEDNKQCCYVRIEFYDTDENHLQSQL